MKKNKTPKVVTKEEWRNLGKQLEVDMPNWERWRERIFNKIRNSGISPEASNLPRTPIDLAGQFQRELEMDITGLRSAQELEGLAIMWVNKGLGKPITKREKAGDKGRVDKREGASNAGRKLGFVTRRLCVHYLMNIPDMTPKLICEEFDEYKKDLLSRDEPDSRLLPKIKKQVFAWNPTEDKIKNDIKVIADQDKLRKLQDKVGVNGVIIEDFKKWYTAEDI